MDNMTILLVCLLGVQQSNHKLHILYLYTVEVKGQSNQESEQGLGVISRDHSDDRQRPDTVDG